jgi:hypothetical protein
MKEVNLSDFVKTTIVEIAKGLQEARDELKELGVLVNPHLNKEGVIPARELDLTYRQVQNISFDLMVSAENTGSTESQSAMGIGMKVISLIGLGADVSQKESDLLKNNSVNRISFSVPISFSPNTVGNTLSKEQEKANVQALANSIH